VVDDSFHHGLLGPFHGASARRLPGPPRQTPRPAGRFRPAGRVLARSITCQPGGSWDPAGGGQAEGDAGRSAHPGHAATAGRWSVPRARRRRCRPSR
jgi:hypothetical protein